MPALETSSASPISPGTAPLNKSSPHAFQSLEVFSASGTIPLSPLSPQQQQWLGRPSSPPSYNTAVRQPASSTPFSRTAEIKPSTHPIPATPLTRPSTSPASLASPASDAFSLAVELREAHQQLLIQKHAIAAALGAELTALKEERARERRQHAVVMRRMEEEVRRMEERARMVASENDRLRAELETEAARTQQQRATEADSSGVLKAEEESREQDSGSEDDEWEESASETALPIFHSQPPSSRPSFSCPLPTRQAAAKPSAQLNDDAAIRQMLDVVRQLSEQIAAIRRHSALPKRAGRGQYKKESVAEAVVYGPGRVWREYEPLVFSAVQPIVFHRSRHYTHYDVAEWGRGR